MSTAAIMLSWSVLSANPHAAMIQHRQDIQLNDGIVRCVAISPKGNVVAGCGDRFIQLFDIRSARRVQQLKGHTKPVVSIAFSPDGQLLASASLDGSIRLWGVGTTPIVRKVSKNTRPRIRQLPRSVTFSPDGKTLVGCFGVPGTRIVLFNVERASWSYDARQPRPEAPLHVAFSPNGARFAVAKGSGNITIMDVVKFGVRDRFFDRVPRIILKSVKSTKFPNGLDSTQYPLKHEGERPATHVAFSRDSKKLLSCGGDNRLRVWDPLTGKSLLIIKGSPDARLTRAAVFSKDGTRIVSVTNNEAIQILDAANGKPLTAVRGTDKDVRGMMLSSDERTLATCGSEKVIKLWRIQF